MLGNDSPFFERYPWTKSTVVDISTDRELKRSVTSDTANGSAQAEPSKSVQVDVGKSRFT